MHHFFLSLSHHTLALSTHLFSPSPTTTTIFTVSLLPESSISASSFLYHYRSNNDNLVFVSLKKVGFLPSVATFNLSLLGCLKFGMTDLVVRRCKKENEIQICVKRVVLRKRRWDAWKTISKKREIKKIGVKKEKMSINKIKECHKKCVFIVAYHVQSCTG
jgi:hypothetical protein